jgi:hypothetical protein
MRSIPARFASSTERGEMKVVCVGSSAGAVVDDLDNGAALEEVTALSRGIVTVAATSEGTSVVAVLL